MSGNFKEKLLFIIDYLYSGCLTIQKLQIHFENLIFNFVFLKLLQTDNDVLDKLEKMLHEIAKCINSRSYLWQIKISSIFSVTSFSF